MTQNPTNLSVIHLREPRSPLVLADREEMEGIEGSYKFNYIAQEIAHYFILYLFGT